MSGLRILGSSLLGLFRKRQSDENLDAEPASAGALGTLGSAAIDPTVPVTIETMRQRVGKLADRPRFNAILLSIFAAMGVLLAAIGMYGVVGFLVAQQTREIGVRAALGLLGAWLCSRLLESLLFQVRAHDPLLLALALLILLSVAFLAAWLPARRAMRVDPMVALRYE